MSREKSYLMTSTMSDDSARFLPADDDQLVYDVSHRTDAKSVTQKSDEGRKKTLSRWDECLNKKLSKEISSMNQKTLNVHPALDKLFVREFLSETAQDPVFPILRELFVRSFDQFYKEIEAQLKLTTNKTLIEWLQATFDDLQDDVLNKRHRCFMLCSSEDTAKGDNKQGIVGFLTLKEEEHGSVYIAQCAIEAENKRRGYGAQLLQHLRTIYPPGTFYWGLCRRANRPAVNFYLKQGAKFMDDEEAATKYRYDKELYTGFQFTDDTRSNTISSASNGSVLPPTTSTMTLESETTLKRRLTATYQDQSTMTDPLPDIGKRSFRKRASCCVIS